MKVKLEELIKNWETIAKDGVRMSNNCNDIIMKNRLDAEADGIFWCIAQINKFLNDNSGPKGN